jgi:hypothetical protein
MDDDIDAAELLRHRDGDSRAAFGGGDIRSHEQIPWRKLVGPGARCDENRRTKLAEARSNGFADSFCAARNKGTLSDQLEGVAHNRISSASI